MNPLRDVPLQNRTRIALSKHGLETIEDVMAIGPDILALSNFGRKKLHDLQRGLEVVGCDLPNPEWSGEGWWDALNARLDGHRSKCAECKRWRERDPLYGIAPEGHRRPRGSPEVTESRSMDEIKHVTIILDEPARSMATIAAMAFFGDKLHRTEVFCSNDALFDDSDAMDAYLGRAIRIAMRRAAGLEP